MINTTLVVPVALVAVGCALVVTACSDDDSRVSVSPAAAYVPSGDGYGSGQEPIPERGSWGAPAPWSTGDGGGTKPPATSDAGTVADGAVVVPPATVAALDCGFDQPAQPSTYRATVPGSPEVHFLGVYETRLGVASVVDTRSAPHVLVLSAHAATSWVISARAGAALQRVVLLGANRHTATVPPGVVVENRSGEPALGTCAYAWPSEGDACDTLTSMASAEQLTGAPVATFCGCYGASVFVVGDEEPACP